jgi:hypothetical protein
MQHEVLLEPTPLQPYALQTLPSPTAALATLQPTARVSPDVEIQSSMRPLPALHTLISPLRSQGNQADRQDPSAAFNSDLEICITHIKLLLGEVESVQQTLGTKVPLSSSKLSLRSSYEHVRRQLDSILLAEKSSPEMFNPLQFDFIPSRGVAPLPYSWSSPALDDSEAPTSAVNPQLTWDPFFPSGLEQDAILESNKVIGFSGKSTSFRRRLHSLDELTSIIDPSISGPYGTTTGTFMCPDPTAATSPSIFEQPPSPAPSHASPSSTGKAKPSPHQSSFLQIQQYYPCTPYPTGRRPTTSSLHSGHSHFNQRSGSFELNDEDREKGMCPITDCGRIFKDLKAHMLTHQIERPEKCSIQSCAYHITGFSRRYDKNRHTLTHYKGTMVCGFCPTSGSADEKCFNRADVFKRHLASVHGVEQQPPNARRNRPISARNQSDTGQGTCSICSATFTNAQEFYEHLDDCVIRVVQQIEDPSENFKQKESSDVTSPDSADEIKQLLHEWTTVYDTKG